MERVLIGRFHSLGDVILATGVVARLARSGICVEVATSGDLIPIFEGLPVARIWTPNDLGGAGGFDRVIDLQANGTSRRLLRSRGPVSRARSRSIARRWTVFWGRRPPRLRIPHCVLRYAEAAGLREPEARTLRPRMVPTARDADEARRLPRAWARTESPCVGLAPGASRRMKRWPSERFVGLARALEGNGLPTLRFEEPDGNASEIEGTARATLRPLKGLLARCRVLVTNDSGMMHLAVALGVPVVAIFGSTVPDFGFGPLGDRDTVLERDLACRPCAPHGARLCWQGHSRCLRGISVEEVLQAVLARADGEGRR